MNYFSQFAISLLLLTILSFSLKAQDNNTRKTERYIEINNLENFFMSSEEYPNDLICNFELYNIYEGESSKPAFVNVNELSNVTKFSIKARSEKYENQRTCYLRIKKINYLSTFGLVLDRLEVKNIKFEGSFITVQEFLSKTL